MLARAQADGMFSYTFFKGAGTKIRGLESGIEAGLY